MKLYNVCKNDIYKSECCPSEAKYHSTYIVKENAEAFCKNKNHIRHLSEQVVKLYLMFRNSTYDRIMKSYGFSEIFEYLEDSEMCDRIDSEVESATERLDLLIEERYPLIFKYQNLIDFNDNFEYFIQEIETED